MAVRYSARVSGATEIALMLLDVLSGLPEIQVAVAYEDENGRRIDTMPGTTRRSRRCRPVYEAVPGWSDDLTAVRSWSDLPRAARDYARFLGERIGVPIRTVSVGPERTQTITEVG